MKPVFNLLLVGCIIFISACANNDSPKLLKASKAPHQQTEQTNPVVVKNLEIKQSEIMKDFYSWYNYTYHNIHLAQDFIGLDKDSADINKATFLRLLSSGKYLPLKTAVKGDQPVYRLYLLTRPDEDIRNAVLQLAAIEQKHFNMEGKTLPSYKFTDLAGNRYNAASTKGKILLLKCWFIRCVACVKEFPELNKLVASYQHRKDILFVSLATDPKEDLRTFLQKKAFSYAVVPESGDYMETQLQVSAYPTHILVNGDGVIVKVTNTVEDIVPFLHRLAGEAPKHHTQAQ